MPRAKRLMTCKECGIEYIGTTAERYCPICREEIRSAKQAETQALIRERAEAGETRPRTCRRCGRQFEAATAKQFCPECKAQKKKEISQQQAKMRGAIVRYCRSCGIAIESSRHALLCDMCKQQGKKARESTGLCVLCGMPLKDGQRAYCAECKRLYNSAAARRARENGQVPTPAQMAQDPIIAAARRRAQRRVRLSGDQIAKLAQEYKYPYNSYGRLRAYIEEFDALPGDEYLRDEIEYDGAAMPECRWVPRYRANGSRTVSITDKF